MELHDADESMGIRKILAHDIRMEKNHKPRRTLSELWIFMRLSGSKVQLPPPHGSFINGVANPERTPSLKKLLP